MKLEKFALVRLVMLALLLTMAAPLMADDPAVNITNKTAISSDGDTTVDKEMKIGDVTVHVRLVGGTAYIAVKKGTLPMYYADGTPMADVPEGTVLKITGFLGTGSGVTVDMVDGKPVLRLAPVLDFNVLSNDSGSKVTINTPAGPTELGAGKSGTFTGPVVTFSEGQNVDLKEGQVGKVAGDPAFIAIGTSTGVLVTSTTTETTVRGGGDDKILVNKNAMLAINGGTLKVGASGVTLTGAQAELVSNSGDIKIVHNGKTSPFATGGHIGGTSRSNTTTPNNETTQNTTVVTTTGGSHFNLTVPTFDPDVVYGAMTKKITQGTGLQGTSLTGN